MRSHLRELFWRVAVVSTRPTVEGRSVLDPFHPLGAVKRLEKKPLRCFTNDCFLKVGCWASAALSLSANQWDQCCWACGVESGGWKGVGGCGGRRGASFERL